jgi:hypothetical protein
MALYYLCLDKGLEKNQLWSHFLLENQLWSHFLLDLMIHGCGKRLGTRDSHKSALQIVARHWEAKDDGVKLGILGFVKSFFGGPDLYMEFFIYRLDLPVFRPLPPAHLVNRFPAQQQHCTHLCNMGIVNGCVGSLILGQTLEIETARHVSP